MTTLVKMDVYIPPRAGLVCVCNPTFMSPHY